MKVGDLVTLRVGETGKTRFLYPGIIVEKTREEKRDLYTVLANGKIYRVYDNDLGPLHLVVPDNRDKNA